MTTNESNDFTMIISLSERMLDNARRENWDDVTSIENERRQLLEDFFSKPIKVQKGLLANGIRTILEKDREIVRLGSTQREQLRGALQKFNRGKNAVQAYSAVG